MAKTKAGKTKQNNVKAGRIVVENVKQPGHVEVARCGQVRGDEAGLPEGFAQVVAGADHCGNSKAPASASP